MVVEKEVMRLRTNNLIEVTGEKSKKSLPINIDPEKIKIMVGDETVTTSWFHNDE